MPELVLGYPAAEIIVVNDGSTDKTEQVCKEAGVIVVTHPYPKGNGAAVKSGARAAKGDYLVFMDGDGQHKAADVGRLLAKVDEGYDLVVGARSGREAQASVARWSANAIYNGFASWMVSRRIDDLTSGFRCVNRRKFLSILYLLPNGFSYPTTSTMAFFRAGYSVGFVPVTVSKRSGQKPYQRGEGRGTVFARLFLGGNAVLAAESVLSRCGHYRWPRGFSITC